jgi:hypothetical protein
MRSEVCEATLNEIHMAGNAAHWLVSHSAVPQSSRSSQLRHATLMGKENSRSRCLSRRARAARNRKRCAAIPQIAA